MSDAHGQLQFYTNGGQVRRADYILMDNGDSLNLSPLFPTTFEFNPVKGYSQISSLFILPGTHHPNLYHIMHHNIISCPLPDGICFPALLHTLVDMSANNGNGKVVYKNRPILNAQALEYGNACRHANGRDWWLVVPDYNTSTFHTLLFNDTGVVDSFFQTVGYKPPHSQSKDGGGGNLFSPDGSIYVDYDPWNGHRIYDFDRCTGVLSNFRWITLPGKLPFGGVAISPNNRFLYITASAWVFQYDLQADDIAASVDTVATWDGFSSPEPPSYTTFGECQLAPDGNIYITPNNSVKHLHYIEYPDRRGDSCQVRQHSLELINWFTVSTPVFPNYRLGPLDGSNCDSLGLNNQPRADYRYTQPDSAVPLNIEFRDLSYYEPSTWSWDFGDGSPSSSQRHPQHTFPSKGAYSVCLTVSNAYGSDTSCRQLYLGVTAVSAPPAAPSVLLAPNPARDYLAIESALAPAQPLRIRCYTADGRLALERPHPNNVRFYEFDISALAPGCYAVEILLADHSRVWKKVVVAR